MHEGFLYQQCVTVVNHSRPHIRSSHGNSINTTKTEQQQHQHSNNNIKCVSNEQGVRVGAASITDEPEKAPAMIKPDLLPTTYYLLSYYLLIHTTYDLSNP